MNGEEGLFLAECVEETPHEKAMRIEDEAIIYKVKLHC